MRKRVSISNGALFSLLSGCRSLSDRVESVHSEWVRNIMWTEPTGTSEDGSSDAKSQAVMHSEMVFRRTR